MPGAGPLSIAHVVCSDAFAGVERYVSDVAHQLSARGHAVSVIGGRERDMAVALSGSLVDWRPATSVLDAQRALRTTGADIVHAHMTAAEIAAVSTRPVHRRPVVATLHFARPRGHGRLRPIAYRQLPRFLDAQIAISRFVADHSGQPADVILNGVPWDLPPAPRGKVVLMAQRHESEKDTATALLAWASSGLGEDGWRLDLAGDGAEHDDLVRLAERLGVGSSVRFLGFVPDVRERMTTASIFLATAPGEPFGLSVVEAMAAGTAVVATASGGHLETIGRVGRGHLFAPGAVDHCASHLRRLAQSPEEREAYGASARQTWSESFTIEHHCGSLEQVYERIAGRGDRESNVPNSSE